MIRDVNEKPATGYHGGMATNRSSAVGAAELADALYTMMPIVVSHVDKRLEEFGMSNTDYWALRNVDGPMPMKDLAHCMDFDPSYVTLVADRLEKLGLIERQPHPTDRRIKNLALTAKGERFKKTLPAKIWDGANTFSGLTADEQDTLAGLVRKIIATGAGDDHSGPANEE